MNLVSIIFESFWNEFVIILGPFWNQFGIIIIFDFVHWGNQVLIIGGTRPGKLGEPPPPAHTIRFSILIVRTPKASLVGEKIQVISMLLDLCADLWEPEVLRIDDPFMDL